MYQHREFFDIHDCIENALSAPILSVESAELTPIGTIAGQFVSPKNVLYNYEMDDADVLYVRSDSIRTDAAPGRKGKKCPGGYTIPANKNCRKSSMTPSAQAKGASVRSSMAGNSGGGGLGKNLAKAAVGAALIGGAAVGANALMNKKEARQSLPESRLSKEERVRRGRKEMAKDPWEEGRVFENYRSGASRETSSAKASTQATTAQTKATTQNPNLPKMLPASRKKRK